MNYSISDYFITIVVWACILPIAILALPWFILTSLLPTLKKTETGLELYINFYKLPEWFKE